MTSAFKVGDLVRVLQRPLHPALELAEPAIAAHERWQMGRVFRVAEVSPAGHLRLEDRAVGGDTSPCPQVSYLHPDLVERVTAGQVADDEVPAPSERCSCDRCGRAISDGTPHWTIAVNQEVRTGDQIEVRDSWVAQTYCAECASELDLEDLPAPRPLAASARPR